MEMTEDEIILSWHSSEQDAEMIKTLAQLNLCKPEEIEEILNKHGERIRKRRRKRMSRTDIMPEVVKDTLLTKLDTMSDEFAVKREQISALEEEIKDMQQTYNEIKDFLTSQGVKVAPVQQDEEA